MDHLGIGIEIDATESNNRPPDVPNSSLSTVQRTRTSQSNLIQSNRLGYGLDIDATEQYLDEDNETLAESDFSEISSEEEDLVQTYNSVDENSDDNETEDNEVDESVLDQEHEYQFPAYDANNFPLPNVRTLSQYLPDWTDQHEPFIFMDCLAEPAGPNLPADWDFENATCLDYFQLFFDDATLQKIVRHTNNYKLWCQQQRRQKEPTYSDHNWTRDTNLQELKAFLGLQILMGVNSLPQYRNYWSTDPFLSNQYVKRTMTKRRFEKLNQYFHVSDRASELPNIPENEGIRDKLCKVRELMTHIEATFLKFYRPCHRQSIDEGEYFTHIDTCVTQFDTCVTLSHI